MYHQGPLLIDVPGTTQQVHFKNNLSVLEFSHAIMCLCHVSPHQLLMQISIRFDSMHRKIFFENLGLLSYTIDIEKEHRYTCTLDLWLY